MAYEHVNLAGRSIACLHTPEHRREILGSRLESVRAIEAAVAGCHRPPAILAQALHDLFRPLRANTKASP